MDKTLECMHIKGQTLKKITLWHEIIAKTIPWELFLKFSRRFNTLEISRKER